MYGVYNLCPTAASVGRRLRSLESFVPMIVHQSANAVLVPAAPTMRMETFSQLWLVNHGVVSEQCNGFFTPVAVQCTDEELDVFLVPNRIQLVSKRASLREGVPHSVDRMLHFIDAARGALPPMSFAGLNFAAGFPCADAPAVVRRLFLNDAPWPKATVAVHDVQVSATEALGVGKVTTKVASGLTHEGEPVLVLDFNTELPIVEATQFAEFSRCAQNFQAFCAEKIAFIEQQLRGDE